MVRFISILLFLLCFSCLKLNAQQDNYWYFGDFAGLSFSGGSPTVLTNGAMSAFEGCATISDDNGILQFYTNGNMVWNRNHVPMPNGNSLNGDGAATQTAIIVPAPGIPTQYYIFTVDTNGGPRGLCYSIVDMTLNGGTGDLTIKNVLLETPVTEKLTAIRHGNGIDAWVLVHGWNSSTFSAYRLTATGINPVPATSTIGINHGGIFNNSHGYLKASADAKKIACAIRGQNTVEVFDFNNATGAISNAVTIPIGSQPYGIEFSPNNQYLYTSLTNNPGIIRQFDLNSGSAANIIASGVNVASFAGFLGALQRGPDGKIYVCQFQSTSLATINNPDVAGTGCNFTPNSIFLNGRIGRYGLPNFLQSFVIVAEFTYADTCSWSPTNFTTVFVNPDSVLWNFGDPITGSLDTSTALNPSHTYFAGGTYTVKLKVWQGLLMDSVVKTITILETPQPNLGPDIFGCIGDFITVSPGNFPSATITWNNTIVAPDYLINKTDLVTVEVELIGCVGYDTLQSTFGTTPTVDLGGDKTICQGDPLVLNAGNTGLTYEWQDGSTNQTYNVTLPGTYFVGATDAGCTGYDTVTVIIDEKPFVNFGPDTAICAGFTLFLDATNANSTYLWQDGSTNSAIFVNDKGTYHVLISNGNCTATDTIFIDLQDKPEVNLGEDTVFCAGQTYLLNAYNYGASYVWQDGSTDSIYFPSITGKVYVIATNLCGEGADTVSVTVNTCNCNVFLPNSFTPNSDTNNDIFNYKYTCTEFFATLTIYNRFGQQVFKSIDNSLGWDGFYEGKPAPEGVYVYVLKYQGYDDGRYADETLRGNFSLVR